ncbi:MAG: hypothetical protein J5940_05215 [Clostridia bacterium]|nr:hypothetical protein [Clostridia bacterium]
MKRFLCVLLSCVMLMAVVALAVSCGETDKPDDTSASQTQKPTESQKPAESQTEATEKQTETEKPSDGEKTEATEQNAGSETQDTETQTDTGVTDTQSETAPTSEITIPSQYLDVDFGGKEFNVIFRYQTAEDTPSGWGQVFDLYLNEDNPDDALSASAKFLMAYMGSTFNCTLNGIKSTNPGGEMNTAIEANDPRFDMVISRNSPNDFASGKFYNLLPMINQDLTCWDRAVIRDLAIGNRLYGVTGNCSTSDDDATWVLFFNKTLLSEHNIEYPYQLVKEGKWTVDRFLEESRECATDLDGDNIVSNANSKDIFGFVTHGEHSPAVWIGCGVRFAGPVQADGRASTSCSALGYEADVFQKTIDVMWDSATGYANQQKNMGVPGGLRAVFTSGRAAFYGECLGNIGNAYQSSCLKDVEGLSFGVIPQPKWNDEQTEYYHYVNNQASFMAIPITSNYTVATNFLNIYGLLFEQTVQATYISNVATAWVSDPDVADMMRLIFDSRVWDAGYWYNPSSIHTNLLADVGVQKSRYSNRVKSGEPKLQAALDAIYEKVVGLGV